MCKRGKKLDRKTIILSAIGLVVGTTVLFVVIKLFEDKLRPWGLWWYHFILIAPSMCILISVVCEKIKKWKTMAYITDFVQKTGDLSFELLLSHILCFDISKTLIEKQTLPDSAIVWIGVLLVAIGIALILRWFANIIFVRFRKRVFE